MCSTQPDTSLVGSSFLCEILAQKIRAAHLAKRFCRVVVCSLEGNKVDLIILRVANRVRNFQQDDYPNKEIQMKHVRNIPDGYEDKFAKFIQGCSEAQDQKATYIVIAKPWVIGDTYTEVMESLSRLAESKLALHIAEPLDKV